jgi:alpha-1,2-glucosyltransferase
MVTLGVFASFVIWNGGVVLGRFSPLPLPLQIAVLTRSAGDKNNHVATIHLPQMLYIWPMFAFFSLPLAIPTMIELGKWVARSRQPRKSEGPSREIMLLREELARSPNFIHQIAAPWVLVPNWIWLLCRIIIACCVAAVVVHFNTIIHPFTLADNRHYMFYIFRYSIRRGELARLALVPVYVVSAWICWTILSPCHDFIGDRVPIRSPRGFSHCSEWCPDNSENKLNIVVSPWFPMSNDAYPDPDARKLVAFGDMNIMSIHQRDHPAIDPTTSSFVISLCIATTLSLMSAPLVEPRYFILPWVFFRLLCPAWRVHEHKYDGGGHKLPKYAPIQYLCDIGERLDVRLVLETFWFLLINLMTMFIFLYYPFYWKEDNGALLDFGRQQRFIW